MKVRGTPSLPLPSWSCVECGRASGCQRARNCMRFCTACERRYERDKAKPTTLLQRAITWCSSTFAVEIAARIKSSRPRPLWTPYKDALALTAEIARAAGMDAVEARELAGGVGEHVFRTASKHHIPRPCGCGSRGLHRKTCVFANRYEKVGRAWRRKKRLAAALKSVRPVPAPRPAEEERGRG